MPFKSKAQAAAMHAAEQGEGEIGIPEKVGKEFVEASQGMKVGKLPKRKGKGKHGGSNFNLSRR
jgi:hypothetical protein